MARPDPPLVPTALVGAAAIVDLSNALSRRHTKVKQDWQDKGWNYYDVLPEIRYPANFFGSSLSRFQPRIGLIPADDPTAPATVPDPKNKPDIVKAAEEQLAGLEGTFGGVSEILFRYGVNMNVAGDGWLVGIDEEFATTWEFLSVKEISFKQDGYTDGSGAVALRDPAGDGTQIELPQSAMLRRFWRPHAEYSLLADAALQALLDDCERLIALNDSITSRLINRLAQAGILFLPSSLSATSSIAETKAPGDGEGSKDPLIAQLISYFTKAITDRSSATGSIPIIVRGAGEAGEQIRHITLDRAIDEVELKLREETRQTIARGLDLPPEVQTGLADASHWTSWSVMDSSYRNHLQPAADRFGDGLTRVFIRPGIAGMFDPAELRRVEVIMDGSQVISRPNEAEDGRQLHDRIAINDAALRRRSGVPEDDAPDEIDTIRQYGKKANDPYLAFYKMKEAEKIEWEKVGKGATEGAPGVGSIPTDKRPADSSDPAGAPGEGTAGGVSDGQVQVN